MFDGLGVGEARWGDTEICAWAVLPVVSPISDEQDHELPRRPRKNRTIK